MNSPLNSTLNLPLFVTKTLSPSSVRTMFIMSDFSNGYAVVTRMFLSVHFPPISLLNSKRNALALKKCLLPWVFPKNYFRCLSHLKTRCRLMDGNLTTLPSAHHRIPHQQLPPENRPYSLRRRYMMKITKNVVK